MCGAIGETQHLHQETMQLEIGPSVDSRHSQEKGLRSRGGRGRIEQALAVRREMIGGYLIPVPT